MRGCFTPIAVCIFDFGFRRALRTREATLPANANNVMMTAQLPKKTACDDAMTAA